MRFFKATYLKCPPVGQSRSRMKQHLRNSCFFISYYYHYYFTILLFIFSFLFILYFKFTFVPFFFICFLFCHFSFLVLQMSPSGASFACYYFYFYPYLPLVNSPRRTPRPSALPGNFMSLYLSLGLGLCLY